MIWITSTWNTLPQRASLTAQSLKVKVGIGEYVWFRIWGHFDGVSGGGKETWGQKRYKFVALPGRKLSTSKDGCGMVVDRLAWSHPPTHVMKPEYQNISHVEQSKSVGGDIVFQTYYNYKQFKAQD